GRRRLGEDGALRPGDEDGEAAPPGFHLVVALGIRVLHPRAALVLELHRARAVDLVPDEARVAIDQVDAPLEAVLEVDLVPSGDGDAVGDDDHARLLPRSGPWYRAPRFPPPMRRLRVPRTRRPRLTAILLSLAVAAVVRAELSGEAVGKVTTLPVRPGPHWFWLSDILLHRTALFDADTGELLGTLSAGTAGVGFVIAPLFAPDHREIYLAETYYARGVRGTRTDVVTGHDAATPRPPGDEIQ